MSSSFPQLVVSGTGRGGRGLVMEVSLRLVLAVCRLLGGILGVWRDRAGCAVLVTEHPRAGLPFERFVSPSATGHRDMRAAGPGMQARAKEQPWPANEILILARRRCISSARRCGE